MLIAFTTDDSPAGTASAVAVAAIVATDLIFDTGFVFFVITGNTCSASRNPLVVFANALLGYTVTVVGARIERAALAVAVVAEAGGAMLTTITGIAVVTGTDNCPACSIATAVLAAAVCLTLDGYFYADIIGTGEP